MSQPLRSLIIGVIATCAIITQLFAGDFPVTLENKFGTTVIEKQPTRVATLDYQGADDLLALGVQPVAIRYWYGDYEKTVWPWAQDLLTSEPLVVQRTIDFEKLAETKPDVIIALWSGITDKDYAKLVEIAPVVAVPKGAGDYSVGWEERATILGKALGKTKKANEIVSVIKTKIKNIADSHPSWKGKTMAVSYIYNAQLGVYTKTDIRTQLLEDFGFVFPKSFDKLGSGFTVQISPEKIQMLDLDLLVWAASNESEHAEAEQLTGRKLLNVYKEKREVFMDDLELGAFSHASLLSVPYILDRLVPKIEKALDKK